LKQVAGKRVRPERDLVMAQIRFAPRPVVLTWRTNGIAPPEAPPTAAAPVTPPAEPARKGLQRRPSLPEFDAARRTLRKTLSGSLAGSSGSLEITPGLKQSSPQQQATAAEFTVAVRTLRKTLSGTSLLSVDG
jgi:hypothetical protein